MKTSDKRLVRKRALPRRHLRVFQDAIIQHILNSSVLETTFRGLIAEEFQRFRIRIINEICNSHFPRQITGPPPERRLRLIFTTNPKFETYTENIIEAESGDSMQIALFDENDKPVTTGQESNAILDVVLLQGDFNTDKWTQKEFESQIEKGRKGKGQLLDGELRVHLSEGVGKLGHLRVMDNSSWTRSRTFRLGVWASAEHVFGGAEVREAKSLPFIVKEKRIIGQKKHAKPALDDQVWRLKKIARMGKYHMKFIGYGIYTVRDFLVYNQLNPNILKKVMLSKHYQDTLEHAQNCEIATILVHNKMETPHGILVFNNKHQLLGIFQNDIYTSTETLDNSQKTMVDLLVKSAVYNETNTEESHAQRNLITSGIYERGECSHSVLCPVVARQETERTFILNKYVEFGGFSNQHSGACEPAGICDTTEVSHIMLDATKFAEQDNYITQQRVENPERGECSHSEGGKQLDDSYEWCTFLHHQIGDSEATGISKLGEFNQQDNYHAHQGLFENDISVHDNTMMEYDKQEFRHSSWDLSPDEEVLSMNAWFVGDPIDSWPKKDCSSTNSSMWLKIRTFIRCAHIIRKCSARSPSLLHHNLTYQANFQNPMVF